MGRTVIYEESNQAFIDGIYSRKQAESGLLIGQLTPQRDYVVMMVATPPEAHDDDDAKEVDGKKSKSKEKLSSIDKVRETWMCYHAKQVLQMLPGGFDIIGLYAAAPIKDLEKTSSKLRQLLFGVHKSLGKSQLTSKSDDSINDRILLQICNLSRKLICKSINVADPQSVLRPAELKFQTAVDKWSVLQTRCALDFPINIPKMGKDWDLNRKLQTSLKSIRKLIWASTGAFSGNVRDGEEELQTGQEGPRRMKQGKGQSGGGQKKFSVELFLQPGATEDEDESSSTEGVAEELGTRLHFRGTIQAQAFVHPKATVKEGLQALKTDILRSLQARCVLMCEDLQTNEGGTEDILQTPKRVFASMNEGKFVLSDYMFSDESPSDVMDRFKEVVGIKLSEEDLNFEKEKLPSPEDIKSAVETPCSNQAVSASKSSGLPKRAVIGAVMTGAVSALAAAFSYMYLQDT